MTTITMNTVTFLLFVITLLHAYTTTAFTANPAIVVTGRCLDKPSMTALFHQTNILERPLKTSKKKKHYIKSTPTIRSIVETKPSVKSLILSLDDPEVRHKVRRRPRKIAEVDREKRHRRALRKFQEGQELARLAVQEVLREYNIDDVDV